LIDAVTARLALDVQRVSLRLDPSVAGDRERLAEIYRYGRVLQHVEHDGRVSLEADLPRRLWTRMQHEAGKSDA
jgi:hypothetical protein